MLAGLFSIQTGGGTDGASFLTPKIFETQNCEGPNLSMLAMHCTAMITFEFS
jgi:hypothetical protein